MEAEAQVGMGLRIGVGRGAAFCGMPAWPELLQQQRFSAFLRCLLAGEPDAPITTAAPCSCWRGAWSVAWRRPRPGARPLPCWPPRQVRGQGLLHLLQAPWRS